MGWTSEVLSGLIGAALALAGQGIWHRYASAKLAVRLAAAFWEELKAVRFFDNLPQGQRTFGGFSSQTFDTLFADMASALPESLARALMRYHWRMKYLDKWKAVLGGPDQAMLAEAEVLWKDLLARLDDYSQRDPMDIYSHNEERTG